MSDVRETAESLLAERPELRPAVRTLADLDADPPWEFGDIPLDSGEFGEVVAEGLVEQRDGGYAVADSDALRAALAGTADASDADASSSAASDSDAHSAAGPGGTADGTTRGGSVLGEAGDGGLPTVRPLARLRRTDRGFLGLFVGSLLLTVLVRLGFQYGSVFRTDHVLMAGNDPYRFVYWVERLLAGPEPPFDPASLSGFPDSLANHDLLLVLIGWWAGVLLGGSKAVAGVVLALYPVLAAAIVVPLLYGVAVCLTADRRVGLATVATFALTPVVAFRTMVGFADHDALDFVLLALTLYLVVRLVTAETDRRWHRDTGRLLAGVALGLALFGQVLAWRGGPIILFPLGITIAALVVSTLRADRPVDEALGPLAVGIGLAAVLSLSVHAGFGWFQPSRAVVPLLLLGGTGLMAGFAAVVRGRSLDLRAAVGGLVAAVVAVGVLAWLLVPPVSAGLAEFLDYMAAYTWSDIVETRSLLSAEGGVFFAPLLLLGFSFVLGLAGLVGATWLSVRRHSPGWLVLAAYGWFFLVMAVVQSRFAGQYALVHSVLGGFAFVRLAAAVDLADPIPLEPASIAMADPTAWRPTMPEWRTLAALGMLFLLVFGLGIVQTPIKQSQLAIEDDSYAAATYIEDFAAERDLAYPDNYVFSQWGRNRFFNYVVSGDSLSYDFAQDNYADFLAATNESDGYRTIGDRTGFVLTTGSGSGALPEDALHTRLHTHLGSRNAGVPGLAHFRAIYATPDDELAVFQVVPGATIRATVEPNRTVRASTTRTLPPADTSVTYVREATAGPEGIIELVTPVPGTYDLPGGTVTVSEAAVQQGRTVTASGQLGEEEG